VVEDSDIRRELEAARSTIAAQAMEIHQLREAGQAGSSVSALRDILQFSDVVGATVGQAPYHALLDGIIQAARRLFDAGAASILLLDHATNELAFEAATGGGNVLNMRIPAHQGIAGWVVMTGEPIAVSDVRRDPRWARDFAESTGYVPQSIMAVPLLLNEDVEGVLEVLDKKNQGSFGLDDMELLGLFAHPAAIAVEQARMVTKIGSLMVEELRRIAEEENTGVARDAGIALEQGSGTPDRTLELARLVHTIGRKGDKSRELAIEILTSVSKQT
jgi:GAF domain-containing protein